MVPERVCLCVLVSMVRERVCLRVSVSMVLCVSVCVSIYGA